MSVRLACSRRSIRFLSSVTSTLARSRPTKKKGNGPNPSSTSLSTTASYPKMGSSADEELRADSMYMNNLVKVSVVAIVAQVAQAMPSSAAALETTWETTAPFISYAMLRVLGKETVSKSSNLFYLEAETNDAFVKVPASQRLELSMLLLQQAIRSSRGSCW
ncbi:hypothetical protein K435DRAFT_864576 [Dendrothele bispora CBS 962.96]|uniref:Uncharacterized protein n=1 Tax=Dendrothele bispora (strain CBS 962.96) TaxID=1314807 RepID=A0A4S8LLF1_DENBC|nr:hypothetical protein K435DRAFT_864576 [Dendrothele bispora CBS 962.96]